MDDIFADRDDAGARLARLLQRYSGRDDVTVLGLVRGGMPVAANIARHIGAPLEALIVSKLGAPSNPEVAIGAVASGGVRVLNRDVIDAIGVNDGYIEALTKRKMEQLEQRAARLGGTTATLNGRVAILVDDGIATGATMRAAVEAVRARGAAQIVVATPVVAADAAELLRRVTDELVAVTEPDQFRAVGQWYVRFGQVSEDEVIRLLAEQTERRH